MDKVFIIWERNNEITKEVVQVVDSTKKTYYLGTNKLGRKSVTKNQMNKIVEGNKCIGEGVTVISENKEKATKIFISYVNYKLNKYNKMIKQLEE
ncbi:hypothetical protein ACIR03_02600 [Clostridium cochlearium]|uniref:hypothetical protein n=1 Tax=Clostridium cochlearium TaxID=1494 RepID=UPI00156FE6FE|nr:hypothetical protein [Clostridium cochlearium]MBV1816881.1 hypothetical protein [Bacteroidales bacterium MSK.15.36]MCG4571754.1 hypothetical protein [Clostridium cochlearium]MCG4579083.1 hypothetical protein [Clostridium cochlearium]NSJ90159.1 hypothetical protein [Coprococcus sp. MSK.21.13]